MREDAFASLLTRALRLLVFVMVPIAVLTAVVRQPVVDSCSAAGKLNRADLDLIALTLVGFLVGLTAHALIAVLARAFYARQDTATPVAAAVVGAVAINCTLAVVLVGPLGLPGIALAIAIAAWIEALVLLAILHRRLPHFELAGLGRVGVESVVGSVVAGGRGGRRAGCGRGCPRARARTARPARRSGDRQRASSGSCTPGSRSCCGSRNCRLSSGSWPTSSAARARS